MQFTNYFFASAVSFLGLLIGIILIKIAPEEQKPLSKYFSSLRKIFLLLMFIFLVFYYFSNLFYLAALILLLAALFTAELRAKNLFKGSMLAYSIFGILFFISSGNTNLFVIESSLIMLYGIPTSSLMYNKKDGNTHKILYYNIPFIIIANLLPFLAPYF